MKVRMAYCYPERTRPAVDERGKTVHERIPNHPTREARASDFNTWLEEKADTRTPQR